MKTLPSNRKDLAADLSRLADADVLAVSAARPGAFKEIVDRYERAFERKAMSLLGDPDDAADAVQEALVRIYAAGPRFRRQEGASFKSWAYSILVNQCFTAYKRRKRDREMSVAMDPELAEILPDEASRIEFERKLTAEHVLSLISRLPRLLARTATLHFIEGRPQKEVARLEGISPAAVRTRIHRAKARLRDMHLQIA